ncbi:MAG: hypothetical protein ACRC6E_01725 [Fusobacteriaceae bacterium]
MKLTYEFQEVVGATKGTYQLVGDSVQVEMCISDTVPLNGEGVTIFGENDGTWVARNFDTQGKKLYARSVRGECSITVVLGFL